MPLRLTLVLLLLPAAAVLALLTLTGHPGSGALAALVTLAGSATALLASRDILHQQLRSLARHTRGRTDGSPLPSIGADRSDEMASLEGAINSLHAQLTAQNATLLQEARILTAVLDSMAEGI